MLADVLVEFDADTVLEMLVGIDVDTLVEEGDALIDSLSDEDIHPELCPSAGTKCMHPSYYYFLFEWLVLLLGASDMQRRQFSVHLN